MAKYIDGSPLSRLEYPAGRNRKRNTILSTLSSDSLSTTGRLLDKLNLCDDDWDSIEEEVQDSNEESDEYDHEDDVYEKNVDTKSVLPSHQEIKSFNEKQLPETRDFLKNIQHLAIQSAPASKFRSLRSVIVNKKQKDSKKQAIDNALAMGTRVNTVRNDCATYISNTSNDDVRSIHLENVLHNNSDGSYSEIDQDFDDDDFDFNNTTVSSAPTNNNDQDFTPLSTPTVTPQGTPKCSHFLPANSHYHQNSLDTIGASMDDYNSKPTISYGPLSHKTSKSTHSHSNSGYSIGSVEHVIAQKSVISDPKIEKKMKDSLMRTASVPTQRRGKSYHVPIQPPPQPPSSPFQNKHPPLQAPPQPPYSPFQNNTSSLSPEHRHANLAPSPKGYYNTPPLNRFRPRQQQFSSPQQQLHQQQQQLTYSNMNNKRYQQPTPESYFLPEDNFDQKRYQYPSHKPYYTKYQTKQHAPHNFQPPIQNSQNKTTFNPNNYQHVNLSDILPR